ncbi:MAG: M50 family metallopeptidase [Candidatus Hodarchaeota archaeon]
MLKTKQSILYFLSILFTANCLKVLIENIGFYPVFLILCNLFILILIYCSFNYASRKISNSAKLKEYSKSDFKKEKSNIKWNEKNIILARSFLGFLLLLLLFFPIRFIFIFFHEGCHVIASIYHGVSILKFKIDLISGGSITLPGGLPTNVLTDIFIAGSLGTIILGLFLLVIIYKSKNLGLDLSIPLFILIGFEIFSDIIYWILGIIGEYGDSWYFLQINPQLDRQWLFILCQTIFWSFIFLYPLFFRFKIKKRIRNDNSQFIMFKFDNSYSTLYRNFDFFRKFKVIKDCYD